MKALIISLLFILLNSTIITANVDSISTKNFETRIKQLEEQLKEVRRDELNYRIEKDLLKETYSNNYERINTIITIILGIIGILGYLGIRDINSIKKEYTSELAKLKQLQTEMTTKYQEFQTSKEKYDSELRDILKTNEEQNKKIKALELKEKISSLFSQKNYTSALEYCIVALELVPDDIGLLFNKALILTRLTNYSDAIDTYNKIIEIDENHSSAILNLMELYLLNHQQNEYNSMLTKYDKIVNKKMKGELLKLFSVIIAYQNRNVEKLKEISISFVEATDMSTKKKRAEGWNLTDMLIYIANEPETHEKMITQNLLWYLEGQITGQEFSQNTKITMSEPNSKK